MVHSVSSEVSVIGGNPQSIVLQMDILLACIVIKVLLMIPIISKQEVTQSGASKTNSFKYNFFSNLKECKLPGGYF